jgi:hypothetical protein
MEALQPCLGAHVLEEGWPAHICPSQAARRSLGLLAIFIFIRSRRNSRASRRGWSRQEISDWLLWLDLWPIMAQRSYFPLVRLPPSRPAPPMSLLTGTIPSASKPSALAHMGPQEMAWRRGKARQRLGDAYYLVQVFRRSPTISFEGCLSRDIREPRTPAHHLRPPVELPREQEAGGIYHHIADAWDACVTTTAGTCARRKSNIQGDT